MVLITGGTHGIGRACVERLARDGRQVVFTGRDSTAGDALQRAAAGSMFVPGDVAIDFGVTGAPETFLVDAEGVIRYKYISPITPEIIATELLPRIALMKQGAPR